MSFDKTSYQREYMARRRAGHVTSVKARMEMALRQIEDIVKDSDKPTGTKIREIVREALS